MTPRPLIGSLWFPLDKKEDPSEQEIDFRPEMKKMREWGLRGTAEWDGAGRKIKKRKRERTRKSTLVQSLN